MLKFVLCWNFGSKLASDVFVEMYLSELFDFLKCFHFVPLLSEPGESFG